MADEKKEEAATSFHDRVTTIKKEAQEKVKSNALNKKVNQQLSNNDMLWAQDTMSLINDARFKRYLEREEKLINEIASAPFEKPSNKFMPENSSFGELMAFNKGMQYGILKMRSEREFIWLTYLESLDKKEAV